MKADPSGVIETTEMHTGGEPVRIVTRGYPDIPGDTILAKRRYAREHLDHLRRALMFEPRGHPDMYGVIPVTPDAAEADLAVLFMHNAGYSTMCGHAVIALGRWAVDTGIVPAEGPETPLVIQCPCGLVPAHVAIENGRAGAVRFESVPAFAYALDAGLDVPGYARATVDVGYGGAFYVLAPAAAFGLDLRTAPLRDTIDCADAVTRAAKAQLPIEGIEGDLAFYYGTILTDGGDGARTPSFNVCVFADRQVDRSPTGSGVTARLAVEAARGRIGRDEKRVFESITGARFAGRIANEASLAGFKAVTVEVSGRAHYTGSARFTIEADDPLGEGFLLR